MASSSSLRRAVAVAVRRDDGLLLAVRRPDEPGEELPGVWGLPATTLAVGESPEAAVRRLGREKLGVELTPLRSLAEGEQQRPDYTLQMTVYEASMAGEPSASGGPARTGDAARTLYDGIDWVPAAAFHEAADRGSLCCALFVALTPSPSPARRERGVRVGRAAADQQRQRQSSQMHVRPQTVATARELRKVPTRGEALLWSALRGRQLEGHKFRRQHPIGSFVVDFYCDESKLIVEVDGPIHESQRDADESRQKALEELGLRMVHFSGEEVEAQLDIVLTRIAGELRIVL